MGQNIEIKEIGQYLTVMGLETNYHDHGEGDPIILIHGSGPGVSSWANWRLTIPALAKHARVIAYDVPGFGFTKLDPEAVYTLDYWLDHLKAFIDALGLDRVSFVGNSFGGMLATQFAVRNPGRVARFAAMGANILAHEILPDLDRLAWGYERSPEMMRKLLEVFPFDKSIITDALVEARFQASNRDDYHAAFASMFPAPRQQWIDDLALTEEQLGNLDCEVMLIHGREDKFVPVDVSVRAAICIPRAQLHVFGQCGHWVQIERSREFAMLLQSFFTPLS